MWAMSKTIPDGRFLFAAGADRLVGGEALPGCRRCTKTSLMWIQCTSYKTSYTVAMADTITFRPDEDASKALEVLTKDGTGVSAAVRSALIDAARRKASAAIRAEAERLAEDESDRAEAMQVLRDMETLRAW
jgi:hypothetical protein